MIQCWNYYTKENIGNSNISHRHRSLARIIKLYNNREGVGNTQHVFGSFSLSCWLPPSTYTPLLFRLNVCACLALSCVYYSDIWYLAPQYITVMALFNSCKHCLAADAYLGEPPDAASLPQTSHSHTYSAPWRDPFTETLRSLTTTIFKCPRDYKPVF